MKTHIDGSKRRCEEQDITSCLVQNDEGGNEERFPEVIISELITQDRAVYYFMNNSEGKLELQSVSL